MLPLSLFWSALLLLPGVLPYNLTASSCLNRFLDVRDLYTDTNLSQSTYRFFCGFQFVKIFKLPYEENALLFGSIFNLRNLTPVYDLELLNSFGYFVTLEYNLVFRVNFTLLNKPQFTVQIDMQDYTVERNSSHFEVVEFAIPRRFEHTYKPEISLENLSDVPGILQSYIMICFRYDHLTDFCEPRIDGHEVDCYCYKPFGYSYVITIIILIFFCVLALIVAMTNWFLDSTSLEPEVQFSLIVCMPGNCKNEYLVIFRVGGASDHFDFENSYIDFQLLTDDFEPIGIPIRFACNKLPDRDCGEMHLVIGRITPMPQVLAVRANHSCLDNLLFFYDLTVVDLADGVTVVQEEAINQYVTYDSKIFTPRDGDEQLFVKPDSSYKLTRCQSVTVGLVLTAFTCLFIAALMRYLDVYVHWHNPRKSGLGASLTIIIALILNLLLYFVLVWIYKSSANRNHYKDIYIQQLTSDSANFAALKSCHSLITVVLCVVSVCLAIGTISVTYPLQYYAILLWSGMTFITLVTLFGVWSLVVATPNPFRGLFRGDGTDIQCADSDLAGITSQNTNAPSFVAFSNTPFSGAKLESSRASSLGPKLVNPNGPASESNSARKEKLKLNLMEKICQLKNRNEKSMKLPASLYSTPGRKDRINRSLSGSGKETSPRSPKERSPRSPKLKN